MADDKTDDTLEQEAEALMLAAAGVAYCRPWPVAIEKDKIHWRKMAQAARQQPTPPAGAE